MDALKFSTKLLGTAIAIAFLAGCAGPTAKLTPFPPTSTPQSIYPSPTSPENNVPSTPTATPIRPATLPTATTTTQPTKEVVSTPVPEAGILFDDFSYATRADMSANGWIVREKAGWPGVPGATFSQENVTLLNDPATNGNRLMRMTSSTDGSSAKTSQTQVCHQRKYLYGTYAARVRFSDAPASGSDGDQVVETFYAITPYVKPLAPDYSEMDFEYLPNGGWGSPPETLHVTTWETVQIEPWQADNTSNSRMGSLNGWHTLVLQADDKSVRYYLDGALVSEHSGNYYPDAPMSINFNLWFIDGGLLNDRQLRTYEEDVDWVFYQAGVNLTSDEILGKIGALRSGLIKFQDTVPPANPPLDSPCDL